ncbi:hypothetical protein [Enterococcus sp. HY326]|uniref:hypothetical protein n=1 Tax=Enterococcus sp. HY326 TaxID=2971265 RepID=UPI00223FDD1B|nr:hypothetical protein [Enterococcus sp. HY326]
MKSVKEFRTDNELVIFLENQNTIIFVTEKDYKTYSYLLYADAEHFFLKLKRALCKPQLLA